MKVELFKYLKKNFSQLPKDIDRLIISAFLSKNRIEIKNNILLKSYMIKPAQKKESEQLNSFLSVFERYESSFEFETLIELFEFVISPADRIVTGAIYTPKSIRDFIVDETFSAQRITNSFKIADISCGCGGFLLTATEKIKNICNESYAAIYSKYIYGLDIEDYSITRAKLLLSILAVMNGEDTPAFEFNLFTGDALAFSWEEHIPNFRGFSIITGNPPYVCSRNIKEETKQYLYNWEVCKSGHPDLYIPFFQIGLETLADNGKLGYITMNSFFKSLNGRAVRKYFQERSYSFDIIDFGNYQVFNKRSTYTCICLFTKVQSTGINYTKIDSLDGLFKERRTATQVPYTSLRHYEGWNLQHNEIIDKIEKVGIPFSSAYKTRNGIATLKNEIFIFKAVNEDRQFYYIEPGIAIEKAVCKNIVNPNRLTTQSDLTQIMEKIIFPYYFVNGKAKIYSEDKFRSMFPHAFTYLVSKKKILATRDNGNGKYEQWFAFGRSQSLEEIEYKLFFPHITPHLPNYVISEDKNLTFYNGISVVGKSTEELILLKKIMSSRLFWYYIEKTSKPYSSQYYSLSKNYIKNFGIYPFSEKQKNFILNQPDQKKIDEFLEKLYQVEL